MTVVPDPIEQADLSAIINRLLDRAADIENIARAGVSVHQRPSDAQLLRLAAADLSRLREERDALRARTTRTTPVDWVVFDPEDACCETFGSEDEAVTYASERIAAYRDPDDGWNEDVAALLVAPVAYRARAVNVQHRDDHTEQDWSDMGYEPFDEVCDYELRPPVAPSPDPNGGEQ